MPVRFLILAVFLLLLGCSAKYDNGSTEVEMGVRGKVHIQYRQ